MAYGFKPARRFGVHFNLARSSALLLSEVNFLKKGANEREFEQIMVASLETSPELKKHLITQVGDEQVDKIRQSSLFGFNHRPDSAIGVDGTAIEVKVVTRGFSVRDLLGQAFAYRMQYRFVILVLIDQTPGRQIVDSCSKPESSEFQLLHDLAEELNVFTIVGPRNKDGNVLFLADGAVESKQVA